jgi:uncharacterized protein (UPF0332 family)
MSIDPGDYYRAAEQLSRRQPLVDEVRHRTVAGRAYYAAFLATRDAIKRVHHLGEEYSPRHDTFCDQLARYRTEPEVSKLGHRLHALRLRRVEADYKLRATVREDDADLSMEDADSILRALPGLEARLPRI